MMKLAWAWASLSSQLGASASRATTSPSWPESYRRLGKSQTWCTTLWTKTSRTRVNGSTCMSTKILPTQRKNASGEAKVHPQWVTSSLWLCPSIYILRFTFLSCQRYVNALEAPSDNFASNIDREMLRGEDELKTAMGSSKRHSNSGSFFSYFITN